MKSKTNPWYRKKCVSSAKKEAMERDGYQCQRCGRRKDQGFAIHASHVYPEGRYISLSATTINLKALCYQCHFQWWHKNPIEAGEWFRKKFPDRAKKLKALAQKTEVVNWKARYEKLYDSH